MSKNSKMSKKERKFVELMSNYFNEVRTELIKEKLSHLMNEADKAKNISSYLCLINLGERTLAGCIGDADDIIDSIKTVCSNIREDEKEKKMLWRSIAEAILEVLEEN